MGMKCKVCKKWMTPKFKFWYWFVLFLTVPALFWWFLRPLGYLAYGLFIVLAVVGFFRRCPFCNSPPLSTTEVLSKIGLKPPAPKYVYIKKKKEK